MALGSGKRRGTLTFAVIGLIIVVVLAGAIYSLRDHVFGGVFSRGEQTVTSESLGASFNDIAELAVEEYAFTRVGRFDESGFRVAGRALPFTGKKFLVTYQGRTTAGIKNFADIDVEVDDLARTVTVIAPGVEVIDTTIDPNSVTVYDQSLNPLNQVTVGDVFGFVASEEGAAEREAVDGGLLDRARTRTEALLSSHAQALIENSSASDYYVQVRWK